MPRSSHLAQLFRCIRWADVLILQGAPVLGIAFSIGPITATKLIACAIFGAGSFLLVTHVFTLNDWADSKLAHDGRLTTRPQQINISPQLLLSFSLSTLAASLLLFLVLSPLIFLIAVTIAALGIFYSHPSLNAKGMLIVSTLLHLVGGLLYFLLGYALFSPIDYRGVAIGLFLGLTFAAGHPVQEARDVLEDRHVGANTNAIIFGQLPCFVAGLILFTAQYVYLFWLAWSGLIPRFLVALPIILYPIQISWAVLALRRGLTRQSIILFENRYRILYAIIGLAMLLSIFKTR